MKQYLELITCILIQTVIINAMRQNEALLLPYVYENFKDIALEQEKKFPLIKSKDSLPSVSTYNFYEHYYKASLEVCTNSCNHSTTLCRGSLNIFKVGPFAEL